MKQDNIKLNGTVVEDLSNSMFRCETENGFSMVCTISGKLRIHNIRILTGDSVGIEVSPYDLTHGRIYVRYQTGEKPQTSYNPNGKNKKKKR